MSGYLHPAPGDIRLTTVLAALGDPVRIAIVRALAAAEIGLNCSAAGPIENVPRSTLSHHFRVLREAGVISMVKKGVENINTLRRADLDDRFPGLLDQILRSSCADLGPDSAGASTSPPEAPAASAAP
ncbi:MAG: helix-turn-helix domain-containing protein [Ancalomicrobiaceae bacterium]|nr:helix-turn-helix domain-containing protein [Ancalomicrobiaceae bacterium]